MASVIIPAHNEETGVSRLLASLADGAMAGDYEVLVICNGCLDRTAQVAQNSATPTSVIELGEPSKAKALKVGDRLAKNFPRLYVDADIVIDSDSIRALVLAVQQPGIEAAAPRRIIDRTDVGWAARWYYDVWEELPAVRLDLFGRGVIAFSESGSARVSRLPEAMSDDLAVSATFQPHEKAVVPGAQVRVFPAQTWRSLTNRRVRVIVGNRRLRATGVASNDRRTGGTDLVAIVLQRPKLLPKVAVFALTTVTVRILVWYRERRGQGEIWHRDETSRKAIR